MNRDKRLCSRRSTFTNWNIDWLLRKKSDDWTTALYIFSKNKQENDCYVQKLSQDPAGYQARLR